jgi:hypothetical protein
MVMLGSSHAIRGRANATVVGGEPSWQLREWHTGSQAYPNLFHHLFLLPRTFTYRPPQKLHCVSSWRPVSVHSRASIYNAEPRALEEDTGATSY